MNLYRLLFINRSFRYVSLQRGNLALENRKGWQKLPSALESDFCSHIGPVFVADGIYFILKHLYLNIR